MWPPSRSRCLPHTFWALPLAPCSPSQLCKWMNSMRQSGFSLARLTVLLNFDSSVLRTVPSTPQGLRKAHWIGKGVTGQRSEGIKIPCQFTWQLENNSAREPPSGTPPSQTDFFQHLWGIAVGPNKTAKTKIFADTILFIVMLKNP